jgi:cytochrome P450
MEALGVPARDWDRLAELGFQQARGEGHDAGPQIYEYFSHLMREKRRNPGDDIMRLMQKVQVDLAAPRLCCDDAVRRRSSA